jgi:hypothetical protein
VTVITATKICQKKAQVFRRNCVHAEQEGRPKMVRKLFFVALVLALTSTAGVAQTGASAHQKADPEVMKLLQLMDKDQNGKVSREEFMAFMRAEFDRLDVNKDGELDVKELTALRVSARHPGGTGAR